MNPRVGFLSSEFRVLRSAFSFFIPRGGAFALFAIVLLFLPTIAFACPVCFGDASSKISTGAQNGILFLLGVIGFVQIGFIALFVSFWRRAKALRVRREQFQLVDGGLQ